MENNPERVPTTKKEAREKGEEYYSTGRPCKEGHYALRFVVGGKCIVCGRKNEKTTAATRGEYKTLEHRKIHIVKRVQSQAKMKNIPFDITVEDIEWHSKCPILGIEMEYFASGGRKQNSVSLDRIDSTLGYVKGNVSTISVRANSIKSNLTLSQAKSLVEYIEDNLTRKDESNKANSSRSSSR